MTSAKLVSVGRVGAVWRYPVKSTLGEQLDSAEVDAGGVEGDRRFGIVDGETGMVASAKQPRRWRRLLQLHSEMAAAGAVRVRFPDGRAVLSTDRFADKLLSEFLGREVTLRPEAAAGAELERAVPEEVVDRGLDAEVEYTILPIAAAAPVGTFFDFSPIQLVTSASLETAGALHPAGRVDAIRYRPNIIIDTSPDVSGFAENQWVGHHLHVGPRLILDLLVPSPRCAIPTLPHGHLPADPDALTTVRRHNFVPVPLEGFGSAPCLGVHAAVVQPGPLTVGDEVLLAV